jgi:hypothetical protein
MAKVKLWPRAQHFWASVLLEEAKCEKGQDPRRVRVGKLTFPGDSKQQDFLTWDYYLSHITWSDLLPAIIKSMKKMKTSI